jgi:hypothetical protein
MAYGSPESNMVWAIFGVCLDVGGGWELAAKGINAGDVNKLFDQAREKEVVSTKTQCRRRLLLQFPGYQDRQACL